MGGFGMTGDRADAGDAAHFSELLDAALAHVTRASGATRGMLYVLPPGSRALRLAVMTGSQHEIAMPWTRVELTEPLPAADAVREQRLVWVEGMQEAARVYPRLTLVLPYDFALAAVPLGSGGTVWGCLVLVWPGSRRTELATDERAVIDTVRGRLDRDLRETVGYDSLRAPERPRIMPTLKPASSTAAAAFADRLPGGCCALDASGRVTFVTPACAELLGTDVPGLMGARLWEVLPWLDTPEVTDRYEAASLSERPTSFPALCPPDHWLSFRLYPDTSGISIRIMPSGTPGKPPPARPAALALGPTRAPILHHLMALAAKLTEAVTVQDVFDRTAGQIMPVLGARALALMAADEGRLRVLGYRGFSDALMDGFEAAPLAAANPATHALTTGETLFFARSDELVAAYPPAVRQDGMASWAFLPLRASGRSIGSLVLAYDQAQSFPPTERAVLTSLAELIGQAVERARLYDTQHAVARRLQAALLPRALPGLPGWTVVARYRPAGARTDVGGDFYDLLRLDNTAAAAVIGDVQGHNIDAAALMGQVRTAIHAHATSGVPPAEVLRRTNRLLIELDRDLLTSVLYARLDLAGHRADLANAGHTWPLLRHPHGGIEILRPPAGLLLGIDREADYPPMDISLPPGCALLLYTDGLIEKPGVDPDDAVAALCELLEHTDPGSLEDMADTLLRHAPDPTDDISLLLISPDRPATGQRAS